MESNQRFRLGEQVDCMDTCNKWLDAKIIDIMHKGSGV